MVEAQSFTLLYLIKQVELAVRAALDTVLETTGLTTHQYTALTVLEQHPGMTAAALARNSFVRAQTAAHLVAALERQGLIEREPDPDSRRQVLIFLSEQGWKVLESRRAAVMKVEQQMTATLSDAQHADLRHALHECRESLER